MLDRGARFGRHALGKLRRRKALGHARFGQVAKVAGGRLAGRDDLARVFVFQLAEREAAAGGDLQRLRQPFRPVRSGQAGARAQVLFAIRGQRKTAIGHRPAQAGRGQRILQRLARAQVHQHVARGNDRQAGEQRDLLHRIAQDGVAGAVQQLDGDGGALLEPRLEPHRVGEELLERLIRACHQQGHAIGQAGQHRRIGYLAFEIGRVRQVAALLCPAAGDRDPVRQVAVAAARLREQNQAGVQRTGFTLTRGLGLPELDLAADDQVQRQLLLLHMRVGAHDAGERTFIGDGKRAVAQARGALDELLGTRGTGEEAEIAAAMQFRIAGQREGAKCHDGECAGSPVALLDVHPVYEADPDAASPGDASSRAQDSAGRCPAR